MHWYLEVLKKYATFRGRARRKEFWVFLLIHLGVALTATIIDMIAGLYDEESGVGVLSVLYTLGVFLPGFAVTVRRLHDINRSGWWWLISVIPIVGWVLFIVWAASDGTLGENRFGPNPKEFSVRIPEAIGMATAAPPASSVIFAERPYCMGCGTRVPDAAAFCPKCGTRRV